VSATRRSRSWIRTRRGGGKSTFPGPRPADAATAGVTGKALGGLRDLLDLMAEVEVEANGRSRRHARSRADQERLPSPSSKRKRSVEVARPGSRTCRSWSVLARLFDEQVERGDLDGLAAIGGVGRG